MNDYKNLLNYADTLKYRLLFDNISPLVFEYIGKYIQRKIVDGLPPFILCESDHDTESNVLRLLANLPIHLNPKNIHIAPMKPLELGLVTIQLEDAQRPSSNSLVLSVKSHVNYVGPADSKWEDPRCITSWTKQLQVGIPYDSFMNIKNVKDLSDDTVLTPSTFVFRSALVGNIERDIRFAGINEYLRDFVDMIEEFNSMIIDELKSL